jgi:hypothetical protein
LNLNYILSLTSFIFILEIINVHHYNSNNKIKQNKIRWQQLQQFTRYNNWESTMCMCFAGFYLFYCLHLRHSWAVIAALMLVKYTTYFNKNLYINKTNNITKLEMVHTNSYQTQSHYHTHTHTHVLVILHLILSISHYHQL